jgi:hypothetical protein
MCQTFALPSLICARWQERLTHSASGGGIGAKARTLLEDGRLEENLVLRGDHRIIEGGETYRCQRESRAEKKWPM